MIGKEAKRKRSRGSDQSQDPEFRKGDWVVHTRLGVGRIASTERKPIQGKKVECFCIQGEGSELWMPVSAVGNGRIRPVASPEQLKRLQRVLVRVPQPMAANHKARSNRIQEVLGGEGLNKKAALLRDLTGRRRKKSLSETEYKALNTLFNNLACEWAVSFGISAARAQEQLNQILDRSLEKLEQMKEKI